MQKPEYLFEVHTRKGITTGYKNSFELLPATGSIFQLVFGPINGMENPSGNQTNAGKSLDFRFFSQL